MDNAPRKTFDAGIVDQIKTRLDHLALFSRFVRLKKSGRKYSGLCPFHKERSPSFTVDPELGLYYCFGCQKGGDTINFLMEMEGLTFFEVLQDLARETGVVLPEKSPEQQASAGNRERLVQCCAHAEEFFRAALERSEKALAYLEGRRLPLDSARQFAMGYAPEGWGNLRDHLAGLRFSDAEMREAGLLVASESGRGYDRFRDRLIYPIHDVKGRAIAFGGRAITPGDEPKYLNSNDTPLYRKSETLYGLDAARGAMRERDFAVIVEGYMDRIALARAGFENAVAGCGTALTADQVRLIARYTRRAVLFYDADAAGQNATRKALELLLPENFQVTIAVTPGGKDADDLLNSGGHDAVQACLKNATPYWPWLLTHLAGRHDLRQPQGREAFLREAVDLLRLIPGDAGRRILIAPLAQKLDVEEGVILSELRKRPGAPDSGFARRALKAELSPVERMLWHQLLQNPGFVNLMREEAEREDLDQLLTSPALLALYAAETEPSLPEVKAALLESTGPAVVGELMLEQGDASEAALRKSLGKLRENRLKYLSRQLDQQLRDAQAAGESQRVNEILKARADLARQLRGISGS